MFKAADAVSKPGVEETRLRILAAARELYARKGSRGTTTREVAELADVNEATLFCHFGTKGQLLAAMATACGRSEPPATSLFMKVTLTSTPSFYEESSHLHVREGIAGDRLRVEVGPQRARLTRGEAAFQRQRVGLGFPSLSGDFILDLVKAELLRGG